MTVVAAAEGQDVHLEVVHIPLDVAEAEMNIAMEDHARTVEDVEGREVGVMTHEIRADARSTRMSENQVVMAADPEIEAI